MADEPTSAGHSADNDPPAIDFDEPYPIREYVGAMAAELARMAAHEGDPTLAEALDLAASIARRPVNSRG